MNLSKVNKIRMNRLKVSENRWIFLLFLISSVIVYSTPIDIKFKARNYTIAYILINSVLLIHGISGTVAFYKILRQGIGPFWSSLLSLLILLILALVFNYHDNKSTDAILNKDGVTCFGIVTKVEKEKGKTYFRASYFYNGKEYSTFREQDFSEEIKERDSIEFIVSFSTPEIYKIK